METTFDFSVALNLVKEGKIVTRKAWALSPLNIRMYAEYPDENSKMTKPYLVMLKGEDKFPLDMSCESIFAEDWYEVV